MYQVEPLHLKQIFHIFQKSKYHLVMGGGEGKGREGKGREGKGEGRDGREE